VCSFAGEPLQELQTALGICIERLLQYLCLGGRALKETPAASHGVSDTIPATWIVDISLEQYEY
jgi:hypothetical protein